MALVAAAQLLAASPAGSVSAIVGVPGTGKTQLAKAALAASPRLLVFDPHAARDRLERSRGHDLFGWDGDLWTAEELARHPEALDWDRFRIVVDAGAFGHANLGKAFTTVADLAWHTGNVDLVAEEAATYSRDAVASLRRLVTGGRHAGIRVFLLSQSFGLVYVDARRCCNRLVIFAQGEPGDLKALRERIGEESAALVAHLQLGDTPVFWQLGKGTVACSVS